jgi:hypothetical protein
MLLLLLRGALLLMLLLPSQPPLLLLLRLLASRVLILWCRRRVRASAGCFHRPKSFAMSKTATTAQQVQQHKDSQRVASSWKIFSCEKPARLQRLWSPSFSKGVPIQRIQCLNHSTRQARSALKAKIPKEHCCAVLLLCCSHKFVCQSSLHERKEPPTPQMTDSGALKS